MSLPVSRCLCAAVALVASVAAPARAQDAPSSVDRRGAGATFCAECHNGAADSRLRGGRSRSTGVAYPNTFVAGDHLCGDFDVDWRPGDDLGLNPGERHVFQMMRDVMVRGAAPSAAPSASTMA